MALLPRGGAAGEGGKLGDGEGGQKGGAGSGSGSGTSSRPSTSQSKSSGQSSSSASSSAGGSSARGGQGGGGAGAGSGGARERAVTEMRRTKKKAPKREPTKVVIQPGGSDNWSRFIIAAMALAFLVWFIHSQSERAALLEMASRNALMHDPAAAAAAGQYGIYAAGAGAGQGASQDLGFAGGQYGMQAGVGAGTEGGAGAGAGLGLGAGGSRQVGSDGAQWEGSSVRQEMRAYSAGMDRALSILAGTPGTPPGSRTPQGGAENDVNGHSQSQSLSQSQSQSQFQSQSQSQFRSQTQSQSFGQYSGQGQGQGQGQKRRWVPLNGSFVMRWGKPKRRYLETSVAKDKLETVRAPLVPLFPFLVRCPSRCQSPALPISAPTSRANSGTACLCAIIGRLHPLNPPPLPREERDIPLPLPCFAPSLLVLSRFPLRGAGLLGRQQVWGGECPARGPCAVGLARPPLPRVRVLVRGLPGHRLVLARRDRRQGALALQVPCQLPHTGRDLRPGDRLPAA